MIYSNIFFIFLKMSNNLRHKQLHYTRSSRHDALKSKVNRLVTACAVVQFCVIRERSWCAASHAIQHWKWKYGVVEKAGEGNWKWRSAIRRMQMIGEECRRLRFFVTAPVCVCVCLLILHYFGPRWVKEECSRITSFVQPQTHTHTTNYKKILRLFAGRMVSFSVGGGF